MFFLELFFKGFGDKIKFIFKYRLINDMIEVVVFKEVGFLVDCGYYMVVICIIDVKDNGKKILVLFFFVDC